MKRSGPLKRKTGLERGKPPERRTRLAPVSAKRRKLNVSRRKFVEETLSARTRCEAGSLIRTVDGTHRCGGFSTDVHEVLTRARGGDILDPDNVRAICRSCHDWIHRNPGIALELELLAVRRAEDVE
jgi:hypothetical protein